MLPITQSAAGWLLMALGLVAFICGFGVRSFVAKERESALVRGVVRTFKDTWLVKALFGNINDEVLTDEDIDNVVLIPVVIASLAIALAGMFFVGMDTFDVEFRIFRQPS
jgi:hypothetical protein